MTRHDTQKMTIFEQFNPRRMWAEIRLQPFVLVATVVCVWLLISLSFVAEGLAVSSELEDWTEGANCSLLSSEHATECQDGPGAGGVGYVYSAMIIGCDEVVRSSAICGEETLAGREWFVGDVESMPGVVVPAQQDVYFPCYVKECTAFEFPAVHRSKERGASATYYTGIIIVSPFCVLVVMLLPFAIISCFSNTPSEGYDSTDSLETPLAHATYTQRDLDQAKWRSSARNSIHVAATRMRADTRMRS